MENYITKKITEEISQLRELYKSYRNQGALLYTLGLQVPITGSAIGGVTVDIITGGGQPLELMCALLAGFGVGAIGTVFLWTSGTVMFAKARNYKSKILELEKKLE